MSEPRAIGVLSAPWRAMERRSPDLAGFLGKASSTLTLRVAGAGLAFVSQVLLARWMGIEQFGIYAFAWTCALALGILCQMGFGVSTTRLVTQYSESGRIQRVRGIVSFSALVVLLAGLAVALCGMAIVQIIDAGAYYWPMMLALSCVPLLALHEVARGVTRGFGHLMAAYLPAFIARPTLILACLGLFYAASLEVTAPVVLAVVWGVLALVTGVQWGRITTWLPARAERAKTIWHSRRWLLIALPVVMVDGQYLMLSYLDIIMLKAWMPAEEIAQYYAAARTMAVATFVHFAISAVSAHPLAQLHARADRAGLTSAMKRYISWTFWPTLAGMVMFLPLGGHVLALFGEEFAAGHYLLPILAVGILLQAATGPLKYLLTMSGQQNMMAVALVGTTVLNIALNLWLIPAMGTMGAAIATSASLSFACLSMAAVAKVRLKFLPLLGCIR